jgi:hypothetical protein
MAIYTPEPSFSRNDRRLLALLLKLLSEETAEKSANAGDEMPMTDSEYSQLEECIEELLSSREFLNATHFIELLSAGEQERSRELYLRGRTRAGRTRALASKQFGEFMARLGQPYPHRWGVNAEEMSFEHFLRMERQLFLSIGVNERVADLLMRYIMLQVDDVERMRSGHKNFPEFSLIRSLKTILSPVRNRLSEIRFPVGSNQLTGAFIVISNLSVLYTTRDWSVTGTLSTFAGGLGLSAEKKN